MPRSPRLFRQPAWLNLPFRALASLVRGKILLVGAALVMITAELSGAVAPLDNVLLAMRTDLAQRRPSGSIVVVEIDAASIQAAGEWPWRRERFATAIRNLRNAGATLVGFDVDFSARSDRDNDTALQEAVEAHPGAIVLPTFLRPGSGQEAQPLSAISRHAVLGSVNVVVDPDGKVRRYWRGFQFGDRYRASMASVLSGGAYGQTAPFLIDYGIRAAEIDRLSFESVYAGAFDPTRIRGRSVLIGATAIELGDRFATPLQPSTPGVYIHALAYENILQGRTLLSASSLLITAIALALLVALWPRHGPLDLGHLFLRQAAIASAVVLLPALLQIAAPVSADLGIILLSQCLSSAACVHRELRRRAAQLVSEREARLSYVAMHEPETELPNRRAMLDLVGRQHETRSTSSIIVVIAVGIERFPILRGAIGYMNATKVVQSLAKNLARAFGVEQTYHISTSILGIVLLCDSKEAGCAAYGRALATLDTTATIDGSEIETQIRAGVAMIEIGQIVGENLLEQATIALDQARLRNLPVLVFNRDETIDPKRQLALIADVRKGLHTDQFSVLYQAKADPCSGAIVGAEALMRWRHPIHGLIPPDQFIQVAEETGSIDSLTRWALGKIIEDQQFLQRNGVELTVALNVSGRLLSDSAFCEHLVCAARSSPVSLCVEITETAIIANAQVAIESLQALKQAGIRVSIDDYGSGLSSLSYLKQLPADELKIDKSLIVNLATSQRDRLIVKSTIDLAHGLGMSVVAEGVENELDCTILAALGCNAVQGFLFSKPSTRERLLDLWWRRGKDTVAAPGKLRAEVARLKT